MGRVYARVKRCPTNGESCQAIKSAVAIAQIKIVRIGFDAQLIACALKFVQGLGLGHIQRSEDQRIQYAKNNGVCADAQRQRDDSHSSKAGRSAQRAEGEAQILEQIFDQWQSSLCSIILFHGLHPAKFQHALPSCLNG